MDSHNSMKKLLFFIGLWISAAYAGGPIFQHKDTYINQEFENIYQDLRRNSYAISGSSQCIDPPTFCVDSINNQVLISSSSTSSGPGLAFSNDSTTGFKIPVAGVIDFRASNKLIMEVVASPSGVAITSGTNTNPSLSSTIDPNSGINIPGSDVVTVVTGGAAVSSFTADGSILQPLQPSFLVTSPGQQNITGDGSASTISFITEVYDQHNDISNSTFTAPLNGKYELNCRVGFSGVLSAHTYVLFKIVTSNRDYAWTMDPVGIFSAMSVTGISASVSAVADMDMGDTALCELTVGGSTKVIDTLSNAQYNMFSGSLIN